MLGHIQKIICNSVSLPDEKYTPIKKCEVQPRTLSTDKKSANHITELINHNQEPSRANLELLFYFMCPIKSHEMRGL